MPEPTIRIGKKTIGRENSPYIIAEAGVNHENDMQTAYKMIEEAAKAGADAIKFQSYKADTLSSKYSPAYWDVKKEKTKSQHELFSKYDKLDVEDYIKLSKHAEKNKIAFLTTCFDEKFVDELDSVLVAYKIASADITNFPLLKKIASKKKPVILSTGASTLGEIDDTLRFLKSHGVTQIALLHCILNYPCNPESAALPTIQRLHHIYSDIVIGYSDHIPPYYNILQMDIAWMLGAKIIEKHFTLDKSLPGNDHYHAMDPSDLKAFKNQHSFVVKLLEIKDALVLKDREQNARKYARRSIVTTKNIKKGEIITPEMLSTKRPGTGIEPKFLELLIGTRSRIDIPEDSILQWNMFLDKK